MAPLLEVEDLRVVINADTGVVHAVRGISLSLSPGEVLGVVGESGAGKSVSALAVMGLLPEAAEVSGSVRFGGRELIGRPQRQLDALRGAELAMVFQDALSGLNPVHRVGSQVAEAVRGDGLGRRQRWERAVEMLDLVGIPQAARAARSYPHELSGGMRQRVMLAMAMVNRPKVLIADEPTTALDVTVQAQVLETLERLQTETGVAVVLITHDLGVVANMADRVIVMYAGRVVEQGSVDAVFVRPRMPYTLGLLGSLPRVDAGPGARLTPIRGTPPSLVDLPCGCPFSPRCPLSQGHCDEEEPALSATEDPSHRSACHRWGELAGEARAEAVFTP